MSLVMPTAPRNHSAPARGGRKRQHATGGASSSRMGLVGRSESWLSRVERGVRRIDSHALLRLATALRVLIVLLRREHRPSTPELRPLAQRAGVI